VLGALDIEAQEAEFGLGKSHEEEGTSAAVGEKAREAGQSDPDQAPPSSGPVEIAGKPPGERAAPGEAGEQEPEGRVEQSAEAEAKEWEEAGAVRVEDQPAEGEPAEAENEEAVE
jgi:hypothetical protein